MSDSPAVILFDIAGNPMAVTASVQAPTGSLGIVMAGVDSTGSVHYARFVNESLLVTGSVGIDGITFPETMTITGSVGVTGSVGITNTVRVTGSVGIDGITFPETINVTGSVGVTGSVSVTNFPLVQVVTGSVGITNQVTVTLTGSLPVSVGTVNTYNLGTQAISGTVQTWTSAPQAISGTIQVWSAAPVGVSGTLNTYNLGTQAISGTVGVNNFPAVQAVSGSQLTGSTYSGSPVVVGGVFLTGSSIGVSASIVKAIQTDISGAVYVTASGSFNVTGSVGITNFPLIQTVTGSVGINTQVFVTSTGSISVTGSVGVTNVVRVTGSVGIDGITFPETINVTGSVGVTGSVEITNFPLVQTVTGSVAILNQVFVTSTGSLLVSVGTVKTYDTGVQAVSGTLQTYDLGTQSVSGTVQVWSATPLGVSGTLNTYNLGTQAISGTVGINNFPAVQAVSGSQITGSTFIGSPVVMGGVFLTGSSIGISASIVKAIQTDISGAVYITTSGTLPVSFSTANPLTVNGTVQTWTSAPQAVSGTVQVWSANPSAVTGTVQTWTSAPQAISGTVKTFDTGIQAVSGSQLTGSTFEGSPIVIGGVFLTGSSIGVSASLIKAIQTDISGAVYITTSGSLPVSFPGGVSVTVTGSSGLMVGNAAVAPLWITVTGSLPVTGSSTIQGTAASGSTIIGNPVLIAGIDKNSQVRIPLIDTDGTTFTQERNEPTFIVWVTGSQIGNNKSMMSIYNATGSTVIVRVREMWLTNVQTTNVVGIEGIFELRRMKGHTGGTTIGSGSIETMDLIDSINSSVQVVTNATTITSESSVLLWKAHWSTDEWGPNSNDTESTDHTMQQLFPLYARRDSNEKSITLRAGDGLTVKHIVNSTAGTFDLAIVFTQVK